jgi:type I restriction enzyme S subunit
MEFLEEMEFVVGDIPEDWKWVKLGDEIELLYGKGLTEKERKNGVYPVYGSSGIIGYHNDYLVKGPGIIIGRKGSVGEVNLSKTNFYPIDTTYYLKLKNDNDIFFFYYLLKTLRLNEINSHSAVPGLSREDVYSLYIPLPPLPEQKAIAEVLSNIDDKIELLHRQNKTLEEMAMTLFRQWFIEPTEDGLPDGWEEVNLGEFFPVITGKKDANFATDDGHYPFFTCSQEPLKAPSYSFDGNAILLAGNGDFNIKRYKGKFEAYQRTYVLIPYNPEYFNFLYLVMKFNLDEITGNFKGSVVNYITKDMITDFKFSLPKDRSSIKDKLLYFDRIYDKVDANTSQIQTLEKLRDTLLPKLMSGEIRVRI